MVLVSGVGVLPVVLMAVAVVPSVVLVPAVDMLPVVPVPACVLGNARERGWDAALSRVVGGGRDRDRDAACFLPLSIVVPSVLSLPVVGCLAPDKVEANS